MRFTVVTFGSDGDTRPYAALSRGLISAGHEVLFFAEQSSAGIASTLNVPVKTLVGDIRATMPKGAFSENIRLREIMAVGKQLSNLVTQNTELWLKSISEHARDSDAILFSGLAAFSGIAAGLELKKPAIGLWLMPLAPTREFLAPMAPPMRLPGWLNRVSFHSMRGMMRSAYGKGVDAARVKVFGGLKRDKIRLDFPILYGMSSHLVARPRDWPANQQVCGHWHSSAPDWQPPNDLQQFMAAGAPPIYVGFGSPTCFVRQKRLDKIIDAIAGRRAVFYPGWSDIDASMLPNNFFCVRETPHDWLFPRCSVVIHHGGAGTTHSSARSGTPSIVLPFGADQFFWASRLTAAGVAPKFVSPSALSAQALAKMIDFTQQDDVRENSRKLGLAMKQEDGVGVAVARIEEMVKQGLRRNM